MTYGGFLGTFLLIPTAVLNLTLRGRLRRDQGKALLVVSLLAVAYTAPWDDCAAAHGLWTFGRESASRAAARPAFVWGRPFWFQHLPLEEYLFYVSETAFVCVAVAALQRWPAMRPEPAPGDARVEARTW